LRSVIAVVRSQEDHISGFVPSGLCPNQFSESKADAANAIFVLVIFASCISFEIGCGFPNEGIDKSHDECASPRNDYALLLARFA
jgi:hypothetical protein